MAMSGETKGSGGTRATSGEAGSDAPRSAARDRQGERRHHSRVRRAAVSDSRSDGWRGVDFFPPFPYWGYNLLRGSLDVAYDIADNVAFSVERTSERLYDDRGYFSPRRHWDHDRYESDVTRPFVRPIAGSPPLVEETDDAYIVEVDTPGVHADDVAVEIRGRRLFISAERRHSDDTISSSSTSRRRNRTFDIEWTVPTNADRDGIEATVRDGILTLFVPKIWGEGPPTRVIPVRSEDSP